MRLSNGFLISIFALTNNILLGLGDAFMDGIVLSQVATSTENHIWTFAAGAMKQLR